jgi:hypothetical protein
MMERRGKEERMVLERSTWEMDESPRSPCLASRHRRETEPSHVVSLYSQLMSSPTAYAATDAAVVSRRRRCRRRRRLLPPPPPMLALGIEWRFLWAANTAVLSLVSVSFPGAWSGGFFPGRGRGGRLEFTGIFTGTDPTEQPFMAGTVFVMDQKFPARKAVFWVWIGPTERDLTDEQD